MAGLGIVAGVILSLPKLAKGIVKSTLVVVFAIILGLIYAITIAIPFIGEKSQFVYEYCKSHYISSRWVGRSEEMRGLMVEIIVKHDPRELKFESEEDYRNELSRLKKEAERKLETGESVLALGLGFILLGSELVGFNVLRNQLFGYSVSLFVEAFLFMIAISIIYRVSILEFLTYSPNHDFSSIEEMDVALSYQKMVCLVDLIQGALVVLYIAYAMSNAKFETYKLVLEKKYAEDVGMIGLIPVLWENVRKKED